LLARRHRLTQASDIARVRAEGKRIRTSLLEVRVAASPRGIPRVAVVVGKHGHGSVDRNRLKRRLRELVRTTVLPGLGAVDTVWRSTPTAYGASFAELETQVASLARQLGVPAREG
jgi:ribonuclease P protein component